MLKINEKEESIKYSFCQLDFSVMLLFPHATFLTIEECKAQIKGQEKYLGIIKITTTIERVQ